MKTTEQTANQNEDVHDFVDTAADKIHKFINTAGAEVGETKDALTERLQVNPILSLAIALGAGVVLDRVVRGKRAEPAKSSWHPGMLMGLAAIGHTAVEQVLHKRLFADAAKIAALVIFAAIVASVGAVGGFYALYLILLSYGVSAQSAMLGIAAGAFVLAGGIMTVAIRSIRRLKRSVWMGAAAMNIKSLIKSLV